MSASDYLDSRQPREIGEERRHQYMDPALTPRRRVDDSLFNKIRWPAFVYSWFILGFVLLVYLLSNWLEG